MKPSTASVAVMARTRYGSAALGRRPDAPPQSRLCGRHAIDPPTTAPDGWVRVAGSARRSSLLMKGFRWLKISNSPTCRAVGTFLRHKMRGALAEPFPSGRFVGADDGPKGVPLSAPLPT